MGLVKATSKGDVASLMMDVDAGGDVARIRNMPFQIGSLRDTESREPSDIPHTDG
ncbi:Hypothetical protein A7982_09926 [Minicystis rosea]|nr:Hypothetical protein A7982_09926 [Minicystis rosea]